MVLPVLFAAAPALGEPLNGAAIEARIAGKRVYLSTPLGIELPLTYAANGAVSGNITGFSMASMFAPKETGRWWVENNQLCQQFPTWYKGRRFCFVIENIDETKIAWTRDDGYSGKARIEGR